MSGAIIKAKLDVKGQMGLRTQHVRGQAASAKACAERAWTAKYAFAQHTRSSDVGRGMPSSPLGSTHGRTTSGVACHLRLFAAHTVERRRAWHAIIAFGQHTRSNDVGRGMPSSPLGSTHGRTTSGVACHHRLWAAHTVERRRAWHAIIAFGQHTRSSDVGRGMPSSPLGSTHGRTTSGVACMPSSPLGSTHGRTASGVACHLRLFAAHTVERRRAWHAIFAL